MNIMVEVHFSICTSQLSVTFLLFYRIDQKQEKILISQSLTMEIAKVRKNEKIHQSQMNEKMATIEGKS